MRKVMLLFLALIFTASLAFAEVVGSAMLPVFLRVNDMNYIEVGFSRNGITSFTDEVEDISGETISLVTAGESGTAAKPSEDIYIYWKIMSPAALKADLEIMDSLIGSDGSAIEWYVALPESGLSIASSGYDTSMSLLPPTRSFTDFGSTKLDIGTESLDAGDVVPGEYKGELRLSISVE